MKGKHIHQSSDLRRVIDQLSVVDAVERSKVIRILKRDEIGNSTSYRAFSAAGSDLKHVSNSYRMRKKRCFFLSELLSQFKAHQVG